MSAAAGARCVEAIVLKTMTPAEDIRKLGFRRWYERQLIEGHVHFVTCLLSMLLVAACVEQTNWRELGMNGALMLAVVLVALYFCMMSLRRYNFLLVRAECFGEQSTCSECSTYGLLNVIAAGAHEGAPTDPDAQADNAWLRVQCKRCGHEWRMNNG